MMDTGKLAGGGGGYGFIRSGFESRQLHLLSGPGEAWGDAPCARIGLQYRPGFGRQLARAISQKLQVVGKLKGG